MIVDWAFAMATKYGLTVLLDLHGAPGSQVCPSWMSPLLCCIFLVLIASLRTARTTAAAATLSSGSPVSSSRATSRWALHASPPLADATNRLIHCLQQPSVSVDNICHVAQLSLRAIEALCDRYCAHPQLLGKSYALAAILQ